jgi:hypothetical protein
MRALSKRREDRFQTMKDLAAAIDAIKPARRPTAPVRTLEPRPATSAHQPERLIFPTLERPPHTGRKIALFALVVALFSTAAWLRSRPREQPGRIEIFTSPDDAEIYVDGKRLADRSPLILEAAPGLYTVVVRREGYEARSRVFTLPEGTAARVTLTLPVSDATPVELVSDPPGAQVWIDGQPLLLDGSPSRTPFSIATLPPGLHVVEMGGLPDLGTWRGEITLRPGTAYAVRGVLPRPDTPPPPPPPPTPSHHAPKAPPKKVTAAAPPAPAGVLAAGAAGAPGAPAEPPTVIEKPFRPAPDSGVLFLDLRGGGPRAP